MPATSYKILVRTGTGTRDSSINKSQVEYKEETAPYNIEYSATLFFLDLIELIY